MAVLDLVVPNVVQYVEGGITEAERFANAGATCPACGSTNTHRVEVEHNGKVVKVYFACNDCGNVW